GKNENFIKFLKENQHSKIIIENMPKTGLNNELAIGYNPEQIKSFLELGSFNFCLDFGHAIKAAISLGLEYKSYITEFMKLNPTMFHLCGVKLDNEKDEHLNLDEGDFDLNYIIEIIKSSKAKRMTFEVPQLNGLKNYFRNMEYFRKIFLAN
ncbi:MAG: sugar phosphate isomerase/epimerase, partial [Nanoarchaeota archaeon]|nr:sugar phosphate isomerase/epimerase [Nanoarchaeota archaeon]